MHELSRARPGRRRILLAASAFLAVTLVRAQGKSPRRIGFLALPNAFDEANPNNVAWRALEDALGRLGFREGPSLVIVRRHAGGEAARLRDAAAELAIAKVDVIAAFGGQNVRAAREATQAIPIVGYSGVLVESGFAESYPRPGRNVTGVSPSSTDVSQKQLEFLVVSVPGLRRVAWLRNSTNPFFSEAFTRRVAASAQRLGVAATPFEVSTAEALEVTIPEIARQEFGAVLVPSDIVYVALRHRLAQLLLKYRLPSASLDRIMLDAGLLLNYGVDFEYGIRRMASQIDQILRGVSPSVIPVEVIESFALGVNMRTARALGLTIPQSVILRADRFIE